MTPLNRAAWTSVVRDAAMRHNLRVELLLGVVEKESGFNPWAWNPEPRYRYLWDVKRGQPFRKLTVFESASEIPPEDFPCLAGDPDQEFWGQQASWGLMQVMGAVARELGFEGKYLTELSDPYTCIEFGSLKLRHLLTWADGDERHALAAYNGGPGNNPLDGVLKNAAYADDVLRRAKGLNA